MRANKQVFVYELENLPPPINPLSFIQPGCRTSINVHIVMLLYCVTYR